MSRPDRASLLPDTQIRAEITTLAAKVSTGPKPAGDAPDGPRGPRPPARRGLRRPPAGCRHERHLRWEAHSAGGPAPVHDPPGPVPGRPGPGPNRLLPAEARCGPP